MSKNAPESSKQRKRSSDKRQVLSAKALAQKVGYLRVDEFPSASIFDSLPRLKFNAGRRIKSKDNLYLVKSGTVIIRHIYHNYFVKELTSGVLFGHMLLLGQTMTGTEAIAGGDGAMLGVLDTNAVKRWIEASPILLLEKLGPRLSRIEDKHYRARYQSADSRLAALLLELADEDSIIKGRTQAELGGMMDVYRETITTLLSRMESDKLIKVGRKKITILDKGALQELSEY
jgi:CRP-like cAMP-binding protein